MEVSTTKICKKILECYENTIDLKPMTPEELGYHQCLVDIIRGKWT